MEIRLHIPGAKIGRLLDRAQTDTAGAGHVVNCGALAVRGKERR